MVFNAGAGKRLQKRRKKIFKPEKTEVSAEFYTFGGKL